jgi:hypothetical protein
MLTWLLTNGITVSAIAFAIWFLNGLRKAVFKPRVVYVSHQDIPGEGTLMTVKRQQLIPPWSQIEETWLLSRGLLDDTATRAPDGAQLSDNSDRDSLWNTTLVRSLRNVLRMRLLKEKADLQAVCDLEKEIERDRKLAETIAKAEKRKAN